MAQRKSKYRFDENRGVVRAKFYELVDAGERPPEIQLCTFEQLEFKLTARGSKRRTATEKLSHLSKLYVAKLRALQKAKKEKPKKKVEYKLNQAITRYCDNILTEKSRSSQLTVATQLKYWDKKGGKLALTQITPKWIVERRDELKHAKRTTATVNRYLAALSVVMSACVREWHLIHSNPVQNVRKLKEPAGRTRYLSEKELADLLACVADNADLKLAVLLALTTGARRMEIWGLKWDDVDLQNGFLTFNKTKTGAVRSVPIHGEALELLKRRSQRLDTPLIFPSRKNPAVPFDFRASFEAAVKRAGIENFTWHSLRHSAASFLIMSGVDLRTVAELLGHKSIAMTQRYTHLAPTHLSDAVKTMTEKYL
jgi:integrase